MTLPMVIFKIMPSLLAAILILKKAEEAAIWRQVGTIDVGASPKIC